MVFLKPRQVTTGLLVLVYHDFYILSSICTIFIQILMFIYVADYGGEFRRRVEPLRAR
jgi:hypothetical protein